MRPLRLEIQAFGPFAGRQVIDFAQLADDALFLIHGKTGSGKTTVLDAMCYALYGKTSGDERDGTDMRSHHADDKLRTELLLDFALGEERYRVKRVPKQTRPKVRGDGVTTQPPEAEFYRIDASGLETESLATGPSKVNAAVIDRLHFDAEQFRQVVVLPQGRFRDLLAARSDDRQKILETLFQTRRYRRVERALKDKARALKEQAKTLTLTVAVRAEEAARLLRLPEDAQPTESTLASAWATLDLRLQQARAGESLARTQETSARSALEQGVRVQKRLVARQAACEALEKLERQAEQVQTKRVALRLARRAAPLAETRAGVDRTRQRAQAAVSQSTSVGQSASAAAERATQAAAAYAALNTTEAAAARAEAGKGVIQLESLQQTVARLSAARAALVQAEAAATQAEAGALVAGQTSSAAEIAATAATQRHHDQKALAAPHEQLVQAAATQKKRLERRDQWSLACSQAGQAARERDDAETALLAATQTLADSRGCVADARNQRHEARAAVLARGLQDGTACPVCGATEHPTPALSALEPPSDAHLKAMEAAVLANTTRRDKAQTRFTASGRSAAEVAAAVQGFERELGEATTHPREQLEREWQVAETRGRSAEQAHTGLSVCAAAEIQALADKEAAETAAAQAQAQAEQARIGKEGAAVEVRTHERDVPQALQDEAALARALRTTRSHAQGLEEAHLLAQEADTVMAQEAAVTAQAAQAAQESAQQREAECTEQLAAWQSALVQADFPNAEAWREACMPSDAMEDLQARIAAYEQSLSAVRDRAERANAEAGEAEPPDLEALQTILETVEAEVRKLAAEASGLARDVEDTLRLRKQITSERARCTSVEERYGVVGRLAQVADGGNAQRLSFQRFVLASRLDEVLDVASQRLVKMTAGRYALRRREVVDHRGRAGGLEIDVDDNETGKVRAARTLSGGEGFLAALALSLATAEVVTAHAGGIRLDAIFVDEGFGSLDDEALDRALGTLLSLREEGRMVGVISHVAELRERIPVRLEVKRGDVGSHASFVVP